MQNPAPFQNRDSIGNPVCKWLFPASLVPPWCLAGCPIDPFLPPWCLPGCPNGSFLPPWCLPGASLAADGSFPASLVPRDGSFPASLVPRERSNESFLASLVPLRLSKWTFPVSLVPHCQRQSCAPSGTLKASLCYGQPTVEPAPGFAANRADRH